MISKKAGFTLIELLVVIAIIGILSSVVLASLNSARNKGADAAVKSNLAGIRAAAEMYYDDNGNQYSTNGTVATGCTTHVFSNTTIRNAIIAASEAAGGSGDSLARCNAYTGGWAASVGPLKATTSYWCVDSSGAAKFRYSILPNTGGTNASRTTC